MEIYLDSAEIEEIRKANQMGWLDGVTTNPSLVAKSGRPYKDVVQDICEEVSGWVSAEVISVDEKGMMKEAHEWATVHKNVVVKIPMTKAGLCVVKKLSQEKIKTNVTLVFSAVQALMAAKAGATLVSPFVGRLDDTGVSGMELIREIVQIYRNYQFKTKILVASVRHPGHVLEAALFGADVATLPYKVVEQLCQHPLTDKGLEKFLEDAKKIKN